MRKLSLAALTVLELAPDAQIDCAEAAGFDFVGLRLVPATPTETDHQFLSNTALQKNCLARLKDARVQVEDIEILRVQPHTKVADFEAVFALGSTLGARSALVAADDADAARLEDNLGALAELAAPYRILPHVEFMPWLHTATLGDAVDLVNRVGHANLSVLIDTIHFNRSGSRAADWARYRGTPPRYLQLCDTPTPQADADTVLAQARAHRLIPGDGFICDLVQIVRLSAPEVALSLEIPGANLAHLPARERAAAILERTRNWLQVHGL